jgi:hypothetical protein
MECLLTREDIQGKSVDELDAILDTAFNYDHFRWQQQNKIEINEPFRAQGLERILYKCPHCMAEGKIKSEGVTAKCENCGNEVNADFAFCNFCGTKIEKPVPAEEETCECCECECDGECECECCCEESAEECTCECCCEETAEEPCCCCEETAEEDKAE